MSNADPPPSFGAYTRDELRRSYADAWRKYVARSPMTPLEALIVDVLVLHPEYQALVSNAASEASTSPRIAPAFTSSPTFPT